MIITSVSITVSTIIYTPCYITTIRKLLKSVMVGITNMKGEISSGPKLFLFFLSKAVKRDAF